MPRPTAPLLSREQIAAAALDLVDESGTFTLPGLAKRLGVSASSIYHHFPGGREAIIEAIRGLLAASFPAPGPLTVSSAAPPAVMSSAPGPLTVSSAAPPAVTSPAPGPLTVSSAAPPAVTSSAPGPLTVSSAAPPATTSPAPGTLPSPLPTSASPAAASSALRAAASPASPAAAPVLPPAASPGAARGEPGWREYTLVWARDYRQAFARHPRMVPLLTAQTVSDPLTLAAYENLAKVLRAAGFESEALLHAVTILDCFILGSALDAAAPLDVWADSPDPDSALGAAIRTARAEPEKRSERSFDIGLNILLGGLSALRSTPG